jgi:signal recognition particle subunit SRP54
MDGDARGGAALSIKTITGKPIKFIGIGEKLEDLEEYHAERIASRVLGMGDIVTLVEKAQEEFDEEQAIEMQKKLKKNQFSLNDFLSHMRKMKKMGGMASLIKLIPGMGKQLEGVEIDDKDMARVEAIILSMTPEERENASLIDGSRRKRIAKGSGTNPSDINSLLRDFEQARQMMRQMMQMQEGGGMPGMPGMPGTEGSGGKSSGRKLKTTTAAQKKKKEKRKRQKKQRRRK